MVRGRAVKACVVVFGREPVLGQVKSRLAEDIGPKAAAQVYAATLEHALEMARSSGARVVLSLADVPSGRWVRDVACALEIQRGGDLGERMDDAFGRRFAEGEDRVVVIGSDSAWIKPTHIGKAVVKLGGRDAVLGPANDGGYWLVAQKPPGLAMFTRIPWSSPDTMDKTRKRITALGGTWSELEELIDIDTADDLDIVLDDPRTPEPLRQRLRDAIRQNVER
jgi:rSAM/selenodomain-associated transferase 1